MGEQRGSISFFGTYRPPVPLGIYSCPADPPPSSDTDELLLIDDESYNQNGQPVPAAALKEILAYMGKNKPKLASECGVTLEDVDKGRVTGLVFVSERDRGLETLHLAFLRPATGQGVKVLSLLGDIYGVDGGVRMEDSGCIAGGFTVGGTTVGHSLVYVSTKAPVAARRAPWTAVYRTDLADGTTERLTPPSQYDLSPAVSPSGKRVAVANFNRNRWEGEIENLNTNITIMNVDPKKQGAKKERKIEIKNGGWPTWGSDNVIFFHRGVDTPSGDSATWAVYRYDIAAGKEVRVTPEGLDAMTPAAISDTRVAVATIRQKSRLVAVEAVREEVQYRHIEIFDTEKPAVKITQMTRPKADHYNPFVLDGGRRVGFHRCRTDKLRPVLIKDTNGAEKKSTTIVRKFDKVQSHQPDVGLFRVTGVFPSISKNGKKLAFVDNEFKAVWLADSQGGLRVVYNVSSDKSVFSTSWNQNDDLDTLYVCEGPAFNIREPVQIMRLPNVSKVGPSRAVEAFPLTEDLYNCAFPSTNPEGTRLVFRGSRDRLTGGDRTHKNLFVMDAIRGESAGLFQLTDGQFTDTHCSWSPNKGCDWIAFSSYRDKPADQPASDHGLDPGCFAVYLVVAKDLIMLKTKSGKQPNPDKKDKVDPVRVPVPVRVIYSALSIAGHINHPVFSPDMKSIVFAADLAAVSADPISMPHFTHSVRPYGDIFSVDLRDTEDITKNTDIKDFHRVTHSRYEYSTPTWSARDGDGLNPNRKWKMLDSLQDNFQPMCPYVRDEAGREESWHMTGQLAISRTCC